MKKINFIIILLTFIVSIVTFFYIDVLAELIVRTASAGEFVKVMKIDILGIILVTFVYGILPAWALVYAYSEVLDFIVQQDYFYLIYFFSLIPLIMLGIFNGREQDEVY